MLSAFDQPCSAFCSPSPPAPLRVWLGITNLARASGGPSVVVQHLSEHLAKAGVLVTILTRSLPDAECEAAPRDGRVRVIRISAQQGLKSSRKWSSGIRAAIAQGFRRNEIDIFHETS